MPERLCYKALPSSFLSRLLFGFKHRTILFEANVSVAFC